MPYADPTSPAARASVCRRSRRWRQRHPDRWRRYDAEYKEKNRELLAAKARERYAKNPALQIQRVMVSQRKHIDWWRAYNRMYAQRRRALEINAPGTFTVEQYEARAAMWGGKCYLRLPGCSGEGTQIEHVISLTRGGSNWPANLRPACKFCNRRKHAKDWRLFIPRSP